VARLIYSAIASLDGYVADARGGFDWAAPDPEVHAFVNELERPIGTYLYGRRMYEVMRFWETAPTDGEQPACSRDFAQIWQRADKLVFSRTLSAVDTARTRLDISVGGPGLAAHAMRAGLVDEYQLFLTPILVGGGTRALPEDVLIELELVEERRFGSGVVYLRYRTG
jgi:dihydrofolate reductase